MHALTRLLAAAAVFALAACGHAPGQAGAGSDGVQIDGSSTVAPLSEAIAEELSAEAPRLRVTIAASGTGGGFERFCAGETDLSNASRPIEDTERERCAEAGVDPLELALGLDVLTVVVHPSNPVSCLSLEQLRTILRADAPARSWSQVDPDLAATELAVFAPDTDSGTYDFMVEALELDATRQDVTASPDDHQLVTGVAGSPGSFGFFGYAYFQENAEALRAVAIDGGDGCVAPSPETAADGSYPLTRPLLVYARHDTLGQPDVRHYLEFSLRHAPALVVDVGYVPAADGVLAESQERLEAAIAQADVEVPA